MTKLVRIFSGLLPILLLVALPVFAYEVALKDGRVIQFQRYRASESALLYIDGQGKEISIPLGSIDLDRTRELNSKENPPLNLPGLITASASGTADSQPSLGDIARKLRKDESKGTKRAYTTDDLQSTGVDTRGQALSTENGKDPSKDREKLSQLLHLLERTTDRQAFELILGKDADVQFPNRPAWESEVLVARLNYISNLKQCLSDRVSEIEQTFRACGQYKNFGAEYNSLSREGRERAALWKSLKEKQK
jgi:hypothetical protein